MEESFQTTVDHLRDDVFALWSTLSVKYPGKMEQYKPFNLCSAVQFVKDNVSSQYQIDDKINTYKQQIDVYKAHTCINYQKDGETCKNNTQQHWEPQSIE